MAILSVVIPCYNSEATLDRCLASLLPFGEELEIIVVNDGSYDRSREIAEQYASTYPFVRVIHQENKGHGGAINTGLRAATAPWFKVLDSDDRVDRSGMKALLLFLEERATAESDVKMILSDFVYEFLKGEEPQRGTERLEDGLYYRLKRKSYRALFPACTKCSWASLRPGHLPLLLMHAIVYRRSFLCEIGLELPEHVSYEDNLFVFLPQLDMECFYYLPAVVYRYFIGRSEQSVSLKNIEKNAEKQLRVTSALFEKYHEPKQSSEGLRRYLRDHAIRLQIMAFLPLMMRSGYREIPAYRERLRRLQPEFFECCSGSVRLKLLLAAARLGAKFNRAVIRYIFRKLGFS